MDDNEFDSIELAKQAADEHGDNWRAVFIKANGRYGFCCLIEQPPHTLVFEQRGETIVSEHLAVYPMAKRGWQDKS